MIFTYGETFAVDLKHADVAYSLFDFWKAAGKDPELKTSSIGVGVSYKKTIITTDKEEYGEQS